MQTARLLTYSLIAGITMLAAVISWQTGSLSTVTSMNRAAGKSSPAALPDVPAAALEFAALEAYDEIVERPLFSKTRRPPAPEPVKTKTAKPPKPKPEPLPDWKLVGTAITTETQAALVWDGRNRRFVRLEPGMKQGGWEIAAVEPELIVMSKGKVRHELKLPRF